MINVSADFIEKLGLLELNVPEFAFTSLEYHRCLVIQPLQQRLFFPFMRQKYPGLFSKGYSKEEIEKKLGTSVEELGAQIVCACLKDPSLYQIAILGEDELNKSNIPEEIKPKVKELLVGNLMGDDDVKNSISGKSDKLDAFIEKWDASTISSCRLSPVGKAIAHTYLQSRIKNTPPLQY